MTTHTYPEDEVNRMLGEQAEKHRKEMEAQVINHRLENIDSVVKSVNDKVCELMEDEKEEKKQILKAIEDAGEERRECERNLTGQINDNNEYNHKTFVKKTDLKLYTLIIIAAVTFTSGFFTWLGTQSNNAISNISADKIAETVIKRLSK